MTERRESEGRDVQLEAGESAEVGPAAAPPPESSSSPAAPGGDASPIAEASADDAPPTRALLRPDEPVVASEPPPFPGQPEASPEPPTVAVPAGAAAAGDRGPTGTGVLPTVPGAAEPRWSARAEVRTPQPREPAEPEWLPEPPPRGLAGRLLITTLVLVLLLITGIGVYLLVNSGDQGQPVVPPTQTSTVPITEAPTSAPPTSAAPTSTAAPTTTAPATIKLPEVKGQPFDTVSGYLTDLGLSVSRSEEQSSDVPAGRVIRTEPEAGSVVAPGTAIKVVVSTGAPPPPPTTAVATTEPPSPPPPTDGP